LNHNSDHFFTKWIKVTQIEMVINYTFMNQWLSSIICKILISMIIWLLHLLSGVHLRGERKVEKNAWRISATEAVRHFHFFYRKNENTYVSFVNHVANDEMVDSISLLPHYFAYLIVQEHKMIMMIKKIS